MNRRTSRAPAGATREGGARGGDEPCLRDLRVLVDNTHTNATQGDRWRRYGAFAVSLAERVRHGASYNPLCERTIQDPYPAYMRCAAQARYTEAPFWGAG